MLFLCCLLMAILATECNCKHDTSHLHPDVSLHNILQCHEATAIGNNSSCIYVFADDIVAIMYIFHCNVSGLCALLLLSLNK